MTSRVFPIRPKRVYWQTHIEAWQRSGVSQEAYCKAHGLWRNTFRNWLKMFEQEAGQKLEKAEKRRKTRARSLSSDKRNKAVQAFWAMHVEAWQWSGLTASAYAKAHHLTRQNLVRWQDRLEAEPEGFDWRAVVHPSARPTSARPRAKRAQISTDAKTSTKQRPAETLLTDHPSDVPTRDGRSHRRSFTEEQKRAIVEETEVPDVSVAAVARRHQTVPSMIFRWRARFSLGKGTPAQFAAVKLVDKKKRREDTRTPAKLSCLTDCCRHQTGWCRSIYPMGDGSMPRPAATPRRCSNTFASKRHRHDDCPRRRQSASGLGCH